MLRSIHRSTSLQYSSGSKMVVAERSASVSTQMRSPASWCRQRGCETRAEAASHFRACRLRYLSTTTHVPVEKFFWPLPCFFKASTAPGVPTTMPSANSGTRGSIIRDIQDAWSALQARWSVTAGKSSSARSASRSAPMSGCGKTRRCCYSPQQCASGRRKPPSPSTSLLRAGNCQTCARSSLTSSRPRALVGQP